MWLLILSGQVVIGNNSLPSEIILKAYEKGYEEVLNLYKAHGFLQASIKVKADTIFVREGKQFKVSNVNISGNTVFKSSDLLSEFQSDIFNESKFMEDIDKIINKYENYGYPYCKVKIDSLTLANDSVNVWLQIIEGPLVRISNIKIEGNNLTKDYVILRELRIRQGDIFCENKVYESMQRVNRLEFVELVESDLVNQDELYISIKERPSTRIDGVVGYGKQGFMGRFGLEILNLIGTGRSIYCNWQKNDTTSTFFTLRYKEPWVMGYPINLVICVYHIAEPLYIKNRAELLLDIPLTLLFTINAGISGTWVNNVSRYREILGVDFNTRRIPGVHYRAKSELNFYKLEEVMVNLDNWVGTPIPTIILFLSANFGAILRDKVELYDKIKLGGTHTLRGYWECEFMGNKVGWLNIEVQKFIGGPTIHSTPIIFPFYDIGYIDGYIKQSFGFGVAANSPIGVIKIIYGLPRGAGFMDGKLHMSIKSTF